MRPPLRTNSSVEVVISRATERLRLPSASATPEASTKAALAKLSVPQYFDQVIAPLVLTDMNRRIERQALQRMAGAE